AVVIHREEHALRREIERAIGDEHEVFFADRLTRKRDGAARGGAAAHDATLLTVADQSMRCVRRGTGGGTRRRWPRRMRRFTGSSERKRRPTALPLSPWRRPRTLRTT